MSKDVQTAGTCRVRAASGDDFLPEHRRLASSLEGTVFQSPPLLELWIASIGCALRIEPHLVIVEAQERALMVLPLGTESRGPFRILRFLDAGVSDCNAPLLAPGFDPPPGWFAQIWPRIIRTLPPADFAELFKMPDEVAGKRNPMRDLPATLHPTTGNLIEIAATGMEQYGADPERKKMVGRLRRKRNGLAGIGTLGFRVAEDRADAIAIWSRLAAFKRAQFLATLGFDEFGRADIGRFYQSLLEGPGFGTTATTAALTLSGEVIAGGFLLLGPATVQMVITGYSRDAGLARFSPGLLLLLEVLRWSIERGATVFDFGEGNWPYKSKWTTRLAPLHDHSAALGWRGVAFPLAALAFRRARALRLLLRARTLVPAD